MALHAKCILFSENYDSAQNELAEHRTLATIPFAGRYRLIDFVLSSLVKANISNIGILTKEHYGSLQDHLGWGKDWDLNRKNAGLKILTPFAKAETAATRNRSSIDALLSAKTYIKNGDEDYIILADTNKVINIDFASMLEYHKNNQADITLLYKKTSKIAQNDVVIDCDDNGKINNAYFNTLYEEKNASVMLNVVVFSKEVLISLLERAFTFGWTNLTRDFITQNINELNIYGFEHTGYCAVINTVSDYFRASMDLTKREVRDELFYSDTPILTRVKNSIPTIYGFDGKVRNSLIADGCVINGELNNCIVFRGVKVEKGAVLNNCIIMQNSVIKSNARLNCVITDKDVVVEENHILSGYETYPFVISKGETV